MAVNQNEETIFYVIFDYFLHQGEESRERIQNREAFLNCCRVRDPKACLGSDTCRVYVQVRRHPRQSTTV